MSAPIRTARALRQQMTPEEKMLWRQLRNKRFLNKKFRRQHPIIYGQEGWRKYFYVADFYCAAHRLVVELDGKQHEFPDNKEYDMARNFIMHQLEMKVLRIPNSELKENMSAVLDKIEAAMQ
jgi:very-short-patch-repair endonuclease